MNLNDRISKVIDYSNLSPSEFADEIDVQRSSISHITSGRNKPSLEFIIKIKSRFPEVLWDWLVTGEGEMLKSELPEEEIIENTPEKPYEAKPTSLPDLYSMLHSEEVTNSYKNDEKYNPRESFIPKENEEDEKIFDSQPLDIFNNTKPSQSAENQNKKIKKIVIFYENGKFESFEP